MNKEQKETLYKNIKKHGDNLKAIFKIDIDSIKLCKMLFRLENKAHQLATDFCNGDINQLEWDTKGDKILAKVETILKDKKNLLLNGDARGYALKIDDKYIRDNNLSIYRDWGGYGIIAPDFRETFTNYR
jgi:hypothetical protein